MLTFLCTVTEEIQTKRCYFKSYIMLILTLVTEKRQTRPCSLFSSLINMGAPTSRMSVTSSLSTSREHRTLPKYDPIYESNCQRFTSVELYMFDFTKCINIEFGGEKLQQQDNLLTPGLQLKSLHYIVKLDFGEKANALISKISTCFPLSESMIEACFWALMVQTIT